MSSSASTRAAAPSDTNEVLFVAGAGNNMVFAVDPATLREVARFPVGQAPKRNATAVLRVAGR